MEQPVHALLLTGGSSRRMGHPKAAVEFHGVSFARRISQTLGAIASPVLAVGPSFDSGLESVADPAEGPLVAFVCGTNALAARRCDGLVLLVACDVPLVDPPALRLVVSALGSHDGVVPVVGGRDQPSVSCWAPAAVDVARRLVAGGHRSMRSWISELDVRRLTHRDWSGVASDLAFTDIDTPEDLERAQAEDGVRRI